MFLGKHKGDGHAAFISENAAHSGWHRLAVDGRDMRGYGRSADEHDHIHCDERLVLNHCKLVAAALSVKVVDEGLSPFVDDRGDERGANGLTTFLGRDHVEIVTAGKEFEKIIGRWEFTGNVPGDSVQRK